MHRHEASEETAARYVAGTLSDAEIERFEQHLLVCELCRNEVRLAEVLRSELPASARTILPWSIGATLAIAASLALVFLRPDGGKFAKLGAVDAAPAYGGIPVRAATGTSDSIFAVAMLSYKAQVYDLAAEKFESARSAGGDSVITTFFRGASLLMAGRPTEAASEFQRASIMSSALYSAESHFYGAKAWLQAGKENEALRELEAAQASEGPVRDRAASLADSVRALR